MPIYILLSTLTQQGVQTLKANPERLLQVNRDIEELGVRVLHQWATLGEFDFVNVVDAPDIETIAKASSDTVLYFVSVLLGDILVINKADLQGFQPDAASPGDAAASAQRRAGRRGLGGPAPDGRGDAREGAEALLHAFAAHRAWLEAHGEFARQSERRSEQQFLRLTRAGALPRLLQGEEEGFAAAGARAPDRSLQRRAVAARTPPPRNRTAEVLNQAAGGIGKWASRLRLPTPGMRAHVPQGQGVVGVQEGEAVEHGDAAARPVFISYASQDAAAAEVVVAALERSGVRCWIAPRDVVPGRFCRLDRACHRCRADRGAHPLAARVSLTTRTSRG